jgi:hypothetical protein
MPIQRRFGEQQDLRYRQACPHNKQNSETVHSCKSKFHFTAAMRAFQFLATVIILVNGAEAADNATSKFGFYPGKSPTSCQPE